VSLANNHSTTPARTSKAPTMPVIRFCMTLIF
jgi:hypothetical protein